MIIIIIIIIIRHNRKGQRSSMYGHVTPPLILIETWTSSRYIYKQNENDKRLYTQRVMGVEQGTFTPLVFTTTAGMGEECKRYHNRLAELVVAKKGEDYATTVSWIRFKVSFATLGRLYSVLEGREQLKEQLEVIFKRRTLNKIDTVLKFRSNNFYAYIFIQYSFMISQIVFLFLFLFIRILLIANFK